MMRRLKDLIEEANNWRELEAKISAVEGEKNRGDLFEEFDIAYFLTDQISNYKEVYKQGEFPQWVLDKLGLKSQQDKGIDAICITVHMKIIAVQAKFRRDRSNIPTQRELGTFFVVSDTLSRDNRIVITNANHISRDVEHRCVPIVGHHLDEITPEHWAAIKHYVLSQELKPIEKFKPRMDQQDCIELGKLHYRENDRGKLIAPCGIGKTLDSMWITEVVATDFGYKNVVTVSPNLDLVRQSLEKWAQHSNILYDYMALCSDKSVGKGISNISETGLINVSVTWEEVYKFLTTGDRPKALFSTYQSIPVLVEVHKETGFVFDIGIFDEAHRSTGGDNKLFTLANNDTNVAMKKRLYMTATEKSYSDGVIEAATNRDIVMYSMDNEEQYGKTFYSMSFKEAIDRDLISDYKIVVAFTEDIDTQQMLEMRELINIDDQEISADGLAKIMTVLKTISIYGNKKTITYNNRIKDAERFAKLSEIFAKKYFNITLKTFHINGTMKAYERNRVMRQFAESNEPAILSVARCAGEGVDIQALDGGSFIDPKQSLIDIIQAIGRILRKSREKYGPSYVIIPVVSPKEDNPDEFIEKTNFETVWKTINAVAAHDESFNDIIRNWKTALGRNRKTALSSLKEVNEKLEIINLPRKLDVPKFRDAISVKIFESNKLDSWDFWYGLTLRYREETGSPYAPYGYITKDGHALGRWQFRQRRKYKNRTLSPDCIKRLEDIGFNLQEKQIVPLKSKWEIGFNETVKYKEETGSPNAPYRYITKDGYLLGIWQSHQRRKYKNRTLSPDRIKRLENIGFNFQALFDMKWEIGFNETVKYKEETGSPNASIRYKTKDGYLLGRWQFRQRRKYKNRTLSPDCIKRLEDIGFVFYYNKKDEKLQNNKR